MLNLEESTMSYICSSKRRIKTKIRMVKIGKQYFNKDIWYSSMSLTYLITSTDRPMFTKSVPKCRNLTQLDCHHTFYYGAGYQHSQPNTIHYLLNYVHDSSTISSRLKSLCLIKRSRVNNHQLSYFFFQCRKVTVVSVTGNHTFVQ